MSTEPRALLVSWLGCGIAHPLSLLSGIQGFSEQHADYNGAIGLQFSSEGVEFCDEGGGFTGAGNEVDESVFWGVPGHVFHLL